MSNKLTLISFLAIFLLPWPLFSFERFTRNQLMMGDIEVTITVVADSIDERDKVWKAMDDAFAEAKEIEKRVSEWQPESDTSLLNKTSGDPPRVVNHDLLLMLLLARDVSIWTGGAFDVTFPSEEKTASYQDVVIDEAGSQVSFRRPGVKLGVSGIAKGYILDRMIEKLQKAGIRNALVNGSGDLRAIGQDGDKLWQVQLVNGPKHQSCSFWIANQAVATTGNSERGKHVINPQTKQAVETMYSATVFGPTSSMTGPLAVGSYVLGKSGALQLLKNARNVQGAFIDLKGEMSWTNGLSPKCR